jgi:plasmid segregation protein ParM
MTKTRETQVAAAQAPDAPLLVAVDDGYAQTKLFGDGPGGGAPTRFMARSSARPGRYALMSISGEGDGRSYRTEEGEEFTVSEEIEGENTQFDGFHVSTMNRVLVNHVLAAGGYGGRKVRLVTGLPVNDFFLQGRKDDQKIADKRANLLKGLAPVLGKPGDLAELVEVQVGCQALAAFFDYTLDDAMRERDVPVDKVAVVDVGGRTTDIALIIDGQTFDPRKSGTANIGVLDVYNALSDLIKARFETKDDYPLAMMDKAVRTGQVKLWGRQNDVSDLVARAVSEQQAKIAREIERRLGRASEVDCVLFVGGGSALFRDIALAFPNAVRAEDPEFANARGLWKYVRYFDGQG